MKKTSTKDPTPWLAAHWKRSAAALELLRKAFQDTVAALAAEGNTKDDARLAAINALTMLSNQIHGYTPKKRAGSSE